MGFSTELLVLKSVLYSVENPVEHPVENQLNWVPDGWAASSWWGQGRRESAHPLTRRPILPNPIWQIQILGHLFSYYHASLQTELLLLMSITFCLRYVSTLALWSAFIRLGGWNTNRKWLTHCSPSVCKLKQRWGNTKQKSSRVQRSHLLTGQVWPKKVHSIRGQHSGVVHNFMTTDQCPTDVPNQFAIWCCILDIASYNVIDNLVMQQGTYIMKNL